MLKVEEGLAAEAAAMYVTGDESAVREVARGYVTPPGVPLYIRAADGAWRRPRPGELVVRWRVGDIAVMTLKEFIRLFGEAALP